MKGLAILQSYSKDELDITHDGFCNLTTFTVKLQKVLSIEDIEILKDIGWERKDIFTWQFEEWS